MKYIITILFVGITLIGCSTNQKSSVVNIDQGLELIENEKKLQLIDVRTPGEYSEGHLENSINIDIYDFENFEIEVNKLSKDQPVLIYCKSGSRSKEATDQLIALGFEEVYDLQGGITKWISSGLETVKD
jgi:rhodanese-related sulfurtransferase